MTTGDKSEPAITSNDKEEGAAIKAEDGITGSIVATPTLLLLDSRFEQ
jgi:hypothetical protein